VVFAKFTKQGIRLSIGKMISERVSIDGWNCFYVFYWYERPRSTWEMICVNHDKQFFKKQVKLHELSAIDPFILCYFCSVMHCCDVEVERRNECVVADNVL
jgi:hypothetical protein